MKPSEINRNFSAQIKIKTFTHDYYMLQLPSDPLNSFYKQFPFYSEQTDFRGASIKMAPVARIYGTNQFGQKCCCHIHGYFPHFYIKALDYSEAFDKDPKFLRQFLETLQNLYQRAYQVNKPIILKGYTQYKYDFYGYHQNAQCFLKITLYDPAYIPKMRQILDSKILCNRSFQCYEAHINYFMQLFSDQNIYGINQMSIMGYTFRKNMKKDIMNLFKKICLDTQSLNSAGWDLIQLERQYPQAFNSLHKGSSCYIEIDFHVNAILNSFEADFDEQQQMRSSDEQDDMMEPNKRKFKVKITKALEQIWTDEKRRRSHYGINKKPKGQIDFSKNIQAHYSVYEKDPLWINFIHKSNNSELFINMIKSSIKGAAPPPNHEIFITRNIAQNYNNVLLEQKQKLIEKVHERWKYYGKRKKNILTQILQGDKDQLPEWDEEIIQSDSESQSNQSSNSKDLQKKLQEIESQSNAPKKPGNTLLYRGNFKHTKAILRKDSYFYICDYCRQKSINCKCRSQMKNLDQYEKTQAKTNHIVDKANCYKKILQFVQRPPNITQCLESIQNQAQKPYYSNFQDLFIYYKINSQFQASIKTAQFLQRQLRFIKQYDRTPITIKNNLKLPQFFIIDQDQQTQTFQPKSYFLQFQQSPPSFNSVQDQLNQQLSKQSQNNIPKARRSTSVGPLKNPSFISDLVVIHYEIICDIVNSKFHYANPESDPIICLVYDLANFKQYNFRVKGMILVQKYFTNFDTNQLDDLFIVKDQLSLLTVFINIIFRTDPDLLITYDQQKKGIRYLTQRGYVCGIKIQQLLSRTSDLQQLFTYINFRNFTMPKETFITRDILLSGNLLQNKRKYVNSSQLKFLQQKMRNNLKRRPVLRKQYRFDIDIKGRVNLNIYRICESDLKLKSYTIQAVTKHLFNEQLCEFTDAQLFQWLKSSQKTAQFTLQYLQTRLALQSRIIVSLNILSVVIQKSKIFGADFISMMQRGSQFKIETVMCRVTKKSGFLTLSASKKQVGNQSVLQCWPLVIEPPKQFFADPVLLFDFQSLYPSVMIAYNLCYSTCLGNIKNLFDENKNKRLGVCEATNIDVSWLEQILNKCQQSEIPDILQKYIFITPNKVAFVKKNVKEGIIPRILLEFLISRIMIKDSSPFYTKQKIKDLLKNRQIALKLFMNVMFGYTGASFSGRMPCSQIADSVVEVAKYSLRQVIDFLNTHPKYKGKVLYGDTDSVFFNLPGYSIKQAIDIGNQLAKTMTSLFPFPMQMKFEKVYDGLFLVSKKRYYGKSYENHQSAPKYQGKGLQCVRRDGIQLTSNIMKQILNKIIDNRDISKIKNKFLKECSLILGQQKLQDQFTLAKQVKLIKYSQKYLPGHGQAARRLDKIDPMLVPKYGERMKYVIIQGGLKPIRYRSISIFEYAQNKKMKLDYEYYLNKQVIPPLQRVLSSLANLQQWHTKNSDMRAVQKRRESLNVNKKCLKCKNQAYFVICEKCFTYIQEQINKIQKNKEEIAKPCRNCIDCQQIEITKCVEWNCPQLWNRKREDQKYSNIKPQLIRLSEALKEIEF